MQNPGSPVSVDEIVLAVECEYFSIYELDDATSALLGDWVAGTDYDLKVTDGVVFKPGLTITPPVGTVTVVLAGSTSADDKAIRQQTFRLFTDLRTIAPGTPRGTTLANRCPPVGVGSSGLQIGTQLRGLAAGMLAAGIPEAALAIPTQKLTFTVDRSVGNGLTFKAGDAALKAENTSRSRRTDNVITIALKRHTSEEVQGVLASAREQGDDVYDQLNEALDALRKEDDELVLKPGDSLVVVPP
jgi:hypothetical protein